MNKYLKKAENGSGIDHYTCVPGTGTKQKITFTKMHGCANDYVYIDCFQNDIQNYAELAIYLSDRHTGIAATASSTFVRLMWPTRECCMY